MTTTALSQAQRLHATHIDLRPLGESRSLLVAPTGQAYEIDLPPETLSALLGRCDGSRTIMEIVDGFQRKEELRDILSVLVEEGCLQEVARGPSSTQSWDLHLMGHQDFIEKALPLAGEWRSIRTYPSQERPNIQDPANALVIWLSPYIDGERLLSLNRHAVEQGYAWCSFHLDSGKGWLGPFVIPGRTTDYEDLLGRRRCAGDDVEGAQLKRPLLPHEGAPELPNRMDPDALRWMLSMLFAEVEHAVEGRNCRLWSTELAADPASREVQPYHILPLPTRVPANWLTSDGTDRDLVLNHRSGIVLNQAKADHHPSLPDGLITIRTHCTDLSRIYPWGNDLFVGGSTFHDEVGARNASLGEALERYCGNCLPSVQTVKGSFAQLNRPDRRCLDPETLILHSDAMLAEKGCPFVPFTRDLEGSLGGRPVLDQR